MDEIFVERRSETHLFMYSTATSMGQGTNVTSFRQCVMCRAGLELCWSTSPPRNCDAFGEGFGDYIQSFSQILAWPDSSTDIPEPPTIFFRRALHFWDSNTKPAPWITGSGRLSFSHHM